MEVISKEQSLFLKESKGKLFEYFSQVSNPKYDSQTLGNIQVWIYGDDRNGFTPHCHVMTADRTNEIEVSLLDFEVIFSKKDKTKNLSWGNYKEFRDSFFKWLNEESTRVLGKTNKEALWIMWDANNPLNQICDYVDNHNIDMSSDEEFLGYYSFFEKLKEKKLF